MRKLLLGLAACALIITGCARHEVVETVPIDDGPLNFSTGIGKQSTKTAELMNLTLQASANSKLNGIALQTYQEVAPNSNKFTSWFQDNVWYSGGKWAIETTRFRNKAKTKYITYFPKAGVDTVDGTFASADFQTPGKFPQLTYTVGATSLSTDQVDLIAGITEIDENKTDIVLAMRHILSQVNFGTVGYSGANIMIRNIKIVDVFNSGTYTYGAVDQADLGEWTKHGTAGTETDRTAGYDYYTYTNVADAVGLNAHPTVDWEATKGAIYAFGDGGNAGPGRSSDKLYPIGTNPDPIWANAHATDPTGLANSLILMPQDFKGTDAKVTFEYMITDADDAYVVGGPNPTDWEKGEFRLDFSIGGTPGTDYMSRWDPNFRYLYLIDFTDFLDGIALTFSVDVETNPWLNHDGGDGGVTVMVAGQPTQSNMNAEAFDSGKTWYIATQSQTAPNGQQWAQVVRHEEWNLDAYDFTQIGQNQSFTLNFENVIFNTSVTNVDGTPNANGTPTVITLTLPVRYTPVAGTGISMAPHGTLPNVWLIKDGKETAAATITITNSNVEYSTPTALQAAIESVTVSGAPDLVYKGSKIPDLKGMEPTALTTKDDVVTVKFKKAIPTITAGDGAKGNWKWNPLTKTATWTCR